ncbi:MAG TPA: phosphoribosyltransferase family protein [Candidatus Paceibacterota bacterium]
MISNEIESGGFIKRHQRDLLDSTSALSRTKQTVGSVEKPNEHWIAVFALSLDQSDEFRDQHGHVFDAESYSEFKYGSRLKAAHFAEQLATFVDECIPSADDMVLSSGGYKDIPSAAAHLTAYVHSILNEKRRERGNTPIPLIKIRRLDIHPGDYSRLSASERLKLMQSTSFAVPKEVRGRHILLIDDVRVTGAHESQMREWLKLAGAKEVTFIYLAMIVDDGGKDAEELLNQAKIHSPDDLLKMLKADDWSITSRAVKFILSEQDDAKLSRFLDSLPDQMLIDLNEGAIGNGFASMPLYEKQYALVAKKVSDREWSDL